MRCLPLAGMTKLYKKTESKNTKKPSELEGFTFK